MSKKIHLSHLFILLGLLFLLSGCGGDTPAAPTNPPAPTATSSPSPFPTRTPTDPPTASPTLRPSSTLIPTFTPLPSLTAIPTLTFTPAIVGIGQTAGPLRDDFSDPGSGWAAESGGDFGFGYLNGQYNMYNNLDFAEVCANRSRTHSDVTIEVDVTKVSGPNNAYFGVSCRKTLASYYSLAINGNGEYWISKTIGKDITLLASGPADVIKKGNLTNHLEGRCVGSTLTLLVNGTQVAQVIDSTYLSGTFLGLMVGTVDEGGIEVNFDNFDSR